MCTIAASLLLLSICVASPAVAASTPQTDAETEPCLDGSCAQLEAAEGATASCAPPALAALDKWSSGSPDLTEANVGMLMERFMRVFQIAPDVGVDFAFIGDGTVENAATAPAIEWNGNVRPPMLCVGRGLVNLAMAVDGGHWDTGMSGLFAHEFGHLRQYQDGTADKLKALDSLGSTRLVELHADFLAGWALGHSYWIDQLEEIRAALQQFQAIGDVLLSNPTHHGEPSQRRSALAAGLGYGLLDTGDPEQASLEGMDFISKQFSDLVVH